MKKMLLALALLLPLQAIAADKDSVYSWGAWAEGIKPAAGPVVSITPAPVNQPNVNFRPNENSAFNREFRPLPPQASGVASSARPPNTPAPTATPGGRFR